MPQDKTGHYYYSWYPSIYERETQSLSLAEDGAYRRLIDHYMTTRSPLPAGNDRAMARILGVGVDEWLAVKPSIETYFKPTDNPVGFWSHGFCEEQIEKQSVRINRNRKNGSAGGRPKSLKDKAVNPVGTHEEPSGTYTKQSKAAKESKNIITSSLPRTPAKDEGDFNDFMTCLAACSRMWGVAQLDAEDQATLCVWIENFDMNKVIPYLIQRIAKYMVTSKGAPPKSLAYFNNALQENKSKLRKG